ncbi:large ribosomal subunit protein uL14m-like [Ciona intestinalis]
MLSTNILKLTALNQLQKLCFGTTTQRMLPDSRNYDNQCFYDGVQFGYKATKSNIRNRDRQVKKLTKRAFQKQTRVRIVDNSTYALSPVLRAARVIQVYKKSGHGSVGDQVLITVNGAMKRALIVGQRRPMGVMKPRTDSNNVIILDNDGNPEGTRITVPLPSWLRGFDPKTKRQLALSKILALATTFV